MLLRGGLREAELLPAELDAVGDGVEIILRASSCDMSDMMSVGGDRSQLLSYSPNTLYFPPMICM